MSLVLTGRTSPVDSAESSRERSGDWFIRCVLGELMGIIQMTPYFTGSSFCCDKLFCLPFHDFPLQYRSNSPQILSRFCLPLPPYLTRLVPYLFRLRSPTILAMKSRHNNPNALDRSKNPRDLSA